MTVSRGILRALSDHGGPSPCRGVSFKCPNDAGIFEGVDPLKAAFSEVLNIVGLPHEEPSGGLRARLNGHLTL